MQIETVVVEKDKEKERDIDRLAVQLHSFIQQMPFHIGVRYRLFRHMLGRFQSVSVFANSKLQGTFTLNGTDGNYVEIEQSLGCRFQFFFAEPLKASVHNGGAHQHTQYISGASYQISPFQGAVS